LPIAAVDKRKSLFYFYAASLVESEFTTAYLGLGSNLGDRAGNLLLAARALTEASFVVHKLSAIYETEPIDIKSDTKFLNMVAEIRVTNVSATQMMARLLRIEYLLGRGDKTTKKPRTVDLDILFFGDTQLESEFLTLPHPRLHLRKFVLVPMAEIAPTFIHPLLEKNIAEILANVGDTSHVRRWDPNNGVAHEQAAKS
jgi:2-amino-4-hydroxy-6-hydroxymethyldihydropteridine diphosphokinase